MKKSKFKNVLLNQVEKQANRLQTYKGYLEVVLQTIQSRFGNIDVVFSWDEKENGLFFSVPIEFKEGELSTLYQIFQKRAKEKFMLECQNTNKHFSNFLLDEKQFQCLTEMNGFFIVNDNLGFLKKFYEQQDVDYKKRLEKIDLKIQTYQVYLQSIVLAFQANVSDNEPKFYWDVERNGMFFGLLEPVDSILFETICKSTEDKYTTIFQALAKKQKRMFEDYLLTVYQFLIDKERFGFFIVNDEHNVLLRFYERMSEEVPFEEIGNELIKSLI